MSKVIVCEECGTVCESCAARGVEVKRLRAEVRRLRAWLTKWERHTPASFTTADNMRVMVLRDEILDCLAGKPAPRKGRGK